MLDSQGTPVESVQVPLRRRDGTIRAYAIIDATDEAWVNQWRWCLSNGYPSRRIYGGGTSCMVYLHRELLGLPRVVDGREGDHRDQDRLNNTRRNLRVLPRGQNQHNVATRRNSQHARGVRRTQNGHWTAEATRAGQKYHLGTYRSEADAAKAAARWRASNLAGTVESTSILDGPLPICVPHTPVPPPPECRARGERNAKAKLTAADVQQIRARHIAGEATVLELVEEYGVARSTVFDILSRKTWQHVD